MKKLIIKRISVQRDNKARSEYRTYLKNKKFDKNDIYIIDILREEMKNDDQRLQ